MKETNVKKQKGVTLIALMITIIVLLILAGVAINAIAGENGILKEGKQAADDWKGAEETEIGVMDGIYSEMEKASNLAGGKNNTKEGNSNSTEGENKTNEENKITNKFNNENTAEIKIGDYVNYIPTPVTLTNSSSIIQKLDMYSGYQGTEISDMTVWQYNKVDSTNKVRQETLKWRVLDKTPEGEIRLISETPTESAICLYDAYDNAVKLIDDFCNEIYGNTSVASNVQNLKIEDIQNKMNLATWDYNTEIGQYGSVLTEDIAIPGICYYEDGQKVSGQTHGTLGVSEQPSYNYSVGIGNFQAMTNTWTKSFGTSNNGFFTQEKYHSLFFLNNGTSTYLPNYWLSSRAITSGGYPGFGVRKVSGGTVSSDTMRISISSTGWDYKRNKNNKVRPVVTLKPSVEITGGNATTGWNIE